jgi:hypothetical protein
MSDPVWLGTSHPASRKRLQLPSEVLPLAL